MGKKFQVAWEDGKTYSGFIKSVSRVQKTMHVVFFGGAVKEFIPDLPLNGPDGFFSLLPDGRPRYTLTDWAGRSGGA